MNDPILRIGGKAFSFRLPIKYQTQLLTIKDRSTFLRRVVIDALKEVEDSLESEKPLRIKGKLSSVQILNRMVDSSCRTIEVTISYTREKYIEKHIIATKVYASRELCKSDIELLSNLLLNAAPSSCDLFLHLNSLNPTLSFNGLTDFTVKSGIDLQEF